MSQSQTAQIKAHLKRRKAITPLDALRRYGCFRLGARIWDLRRAGMCIKTTMVEQAGHRFARYRIAA